MSGNSFCQTLGRNISYKNITNGIRIIIFTFWFSECFTTLKSLQVARELFKTHSPFSCSSVTATSMLSLQRELDHQKHLAIGSFVVIIDWLSRGAFVELNYLRRSVTFRRVEQLLFTNTPQTTVEFFTECFFYSLPKTF